MCWDKTNVSPNIARAFKSGCYIIGYIFAFVIIKQQYKVWYHFWAWYSFSHEHDSMQKLLIFLRDVQLDWIDADPSIARSEGNV